MDHITAEQLKQRLEDAKSKVTVGGKYYHYKDSSKHYLVVDIAILEATEEPAVLYKPLYEGYEGIIWIRPISEFLSQNEKDGIMVSKFTLVQE